MTAMINHDMFRFVDLPEEQATLTAEEMGFVVRVVERDGEQYNVTADLRSDRVNFVITQGVVTEAKVG